MALSSTLKGLGQPIPPRQNVHHHVRQTFVFASEQEVKEIGYALEKLGRVRTQASYDLRVRPAFASVTAAQGWVQQAIDALALLDAIEADPMRRTAAIASLPPLPP